MHDLVVELERDALLYPLLNEPEGEDGNSVCVRQFCPTLPISSDRPPSPAPPAPPPPPNASLTGGERAHSIRVRGEITGSPKYRNVGGS
eukprot:COSAG01_NODE_7839_length_3032_cov_1.855779_3_plen_89_part_00